MKSGWCDCPGPCHCDDTEADTAYWEAKVETREELQKLVKGEWVDLTRFPGHGWGCRLSEDWWLEVEDETGIAELSALTIQGGFRVVACSVSHDGISALRALLSGHSAGLVIGILAHLKALPWREEPDPTLGGWWWVTWADEPHGPVLVRYYCDDPALGVWCWDPPEGCGLEYDSEQPIRWMIACPPPEAPAGRG